MTNIEPYNNTRMVPVNMGVLENLRAQAQAWEFADALAGHLIQSDYAGPFKGKRQNLAAAILKGASLGIPAEDIGSKIYAVRGVPALYGETSLAIARAAGYKFEKVEYEPTVVTVKATAPDGDEWVSSYPLARAEREGLVKGNPQYEARPERMLFWKCIGELAKQFFPHLLNGMPIKEDMEQEPAVSPVRMRAERVSVDQAAARVREAVGLPAAVEPAVEPAAEPEVARVAEIEAATSQEELEALMNRMVSEADPEEWVGLLVPAADKRKLELESGTTK